MSGTTDEAYLLLKARAEKLEAALREIADKGCKLGILRGKCATDNIRRHDPCPACLAQDALAERVA